MDRDIINHPWGQSQDWTNEVKGYSPSHWLSGPPRAPYGFTGEVQPPFSEPQMPLEGEQGPFYDAVPATSGVASYDDVYPSTGVVYAPQSYNNQSPNQNTKVMEYTQNTSQQQNNPSQQQNNSENTLDWYKILYTGSIILMGVGSIAVAVIQYKMYSEKQKQKNKPNPYHYDADKSES